MLKIKSNVPIIALKGETGRIHLKADRLYIMIKYWLKLTTKNGNKLVKDAYKLQLSWVERNKECWLGDLTHILSSHRFYDV